MLFRAELRSLGYKITSLQERVVRGVAIDALRPAIHMLSKVELPEGTILRMSTSASVGTSHQRREAIVELPPCLRAQYGQLIADATAWERGNADDRRRRSNEPQRLLAVKAAEIADIGKSLQLTPSLHRLRGAACEMVVICAGRKEKLRSSSRPSPGSQFDFLAGA
jgi:hypothetical protein